MTETYPLTVARTPHSRKEPDMAETIRVTYERSYLVRRVETWTADIDPGDLTEDALEALAAGYYDSDLDELIINNGDCESGDYEHVDEWDIEGTPKVSHRERLELLLREG